MEKFIKLIVRLNSKEVAEILVANLSEIGFYAFDEEYIVAKPDEFHLNAYIREADYSEKKVIEILRPGKQYSVLVIADQNWNAGWESGFQPVYVHSFAGIRAAFHKPLSQVKHEIIITPKMSFGTGHHATTFLMVEQMEAMEFEDKTVVDFGTGTGILAILAERCGAARVFAIDKDGWSIENATENIHYNHCEKIEIIQGDSLLKIKKTDIILANIDRTTLLDKASDFSSVAAPGDLILISGFLNKDVDLIVSTFNAHDFVEMTVSERDTWSCLLMTKL